MKNTLHSLWLAAVLLLGGQLAWAMPENAVNVNAAPAEELAEVLVGVGIKRAEAIVEYREKFGDFEVAADLLSVRGIGEHVVETNRDKIHFSD